MDATFLAKIKSDFPEYRFVRGRRLSFRPPRTVVVGGGVGIGGAGDDGGAGGGDELRLLHELGHALCGHRDFSTGAQRLKMEREAWDKAVWLAGKYGVEVDEELIEGELDTYRDWLHQKSRCPKCGLTRFQTPDGVYHCPLCNKLGGNKK